MNTTFLDYQEAALRTAPPKGDRDQDLASLTLAACGELGELANKIKKVWAHGHALERKDLADEIGDVLWYLVAISDRLGFNLEEIALENVAKLLERYPEGWDPKRSKAREVR